MKKAARTARYIAVEILCRWEKTYLPADQLVEQYLSQTALKDPRDRQLIVSLVYGTIRWRGYLDWVITKVSKFPLAKMKSRTVQALRVGLVQLLFLDRIPASAAINETVQVLKDMEQPKWLTGFVNGLLRNVDRGRHKMPHPLQIKHRELLPEAALLSHPEWLIQRWKKRYGSPVTAAICKANNTIAPLCLRTNTSRTTPSALLEKLSNYGLDVEAGKYSPFAVMTHGHRGPVAAVPGFAEGLFQVQDEAAQLIAMLIGPLLPGESYLDGCAGLGGKTSHLAQMLLPESNLVAIEPNPGRIKKLQENLERLRLDTTVTIIEGTLDMLLPLYKGHFKGVLIDAPCSGLGVIRRHPDIRWHRSPESLRTYQKKQVALLRDAAQLMKAEGILVYATCSTEPEENDAVIQLFLAEHPDFFPSDCRTVLPAGTARLVDRKGYFRTMPGRHDLDGFFAARLVKKPH